MAELDDRLTRLEREFAERGIEEGGPQDEDALAFAIEELNELRSRARLVGTYMNCVVTTDTRDADAQARLSVVDTLSSRVGKLLTRLCAYIGGFDLESLPGSGLISDHRYFLERAKTRSQHLMSPGEEALAADLRLTGATAWEKLHSDITSQLEVEVELAGGSRRLPMSAVRNLAYDPDRDVRRAAYQAELGAWRASQVPLAACMNSIKGEVVTLCKRRKWDDPLDEALFGAAIDKQALEAMTSAAKSFFPVLRRYLRAKARRLGLTRLAWYDIFAPVVGEARTWRFEEACDFVATHFGTYSERLGSFARQAFNERWVDAEPRLGKVDGAYCASPRAGESRILMNFKPVLGSVSTLAHELGHAYHNLCLANRTELQKGTPMTLAETASIFCETIVRRAALAQSTDEDKISILEASLQGACQVVLDIMSRFLFEQRVFVDRRARELSPDELCEAMVWAQSETYGDGLDAEFLHPYMWAAKPHYYDPASFYNYPYMFGFLFGLGLFTRYQSAPDEFRAGYDDLLSSTGMADAAALARRFGVDIRSEEFWRTSLDTVRADVEEFEALAG